MAVCDKQLVAVDARADELDVPTVSVVIPSYGRPVDIERLLGSIAGSVGLGPGELEVIVVTDGYPADLEARLGDELATAGIRLSITRVGQRIPVSHSRNLGASTARGAHLLFVDDDNEFDRHTVRALLDAMRPISVSLAGPVMYYGDGREQVWCAGLQRTRFLARTRWVRQIPDPPPATIATADLPNCFMVRRHEFDAVGGFDGHRFPQAYEEADLAHRLAGAGGNDHVSVCVTAARTWHHMPRDDPHRVYHLKGSYSAYLHARNRRLFLARHGTATQRWVDRLGGCLVFVPPYLWAMRSAPAALRRPMAVAYLRGLSGRPYRGPGPSESR